jgi:hypothetical protein
MSDSFKAMTPAGRASLIQSRQRRMPATGGKPKQIVRPEPDGRRRIGMGSLDMDRFKAAGSPRAGLGDLIDLINHSVQCPVWALPVIEQVRWTLAGPIPTEAVQNTFGAEIDLFGSSKNPEGIDSVETTMAQIGELQTNTLAVAIGFHLEPEPLCFTVEGNAWTIPLAPQAKPPSPDVFTVNDINNGALGAAFQGGAEAAAVMIPAVLEWGWWANYVAWHMVRGFDLRWRIGQHTNIMDEVLRHTAYMPPSAQEGSASSSEVDVNQFIRRANNRYQARLGTGMDFLKIDSLRYGTTGVAGANVGLFRPSRAYELAGATYGGMDLRSMLRGNSEFRQLTVPYLIAAGIPIGLFCQVCDEVQAGIMREYLDVRQGYNGTVPPLVTDTANETGATTTGGASPEMLEQNNDTPPVNVPQTYFTERALYKGGDLKISMLVKGFEVDADWYNMLANSKDLREIVLHETGLAWARR